MQSINDLIVDSFGENKITSTSTLEILKEIIANIIAYDEFYKEKNGNYPSEKQNFTLPIELGATLESLERQLENIYTKVNDLNISKRIEALNNIYERDQQLKEKNIDETKLKIKELLKQLEELSNKVDSLNVSKDLETLNPKEPNIVSEQEQQLKEKAIEETKLQIKELLKQLEELSKDVENFSVSKGMKAFNPKELTTIYGKEQELKVKTIEETKLKIKELLKQLDGNLKFYGTIEYKSKFNQLTLRLNSKTTTTIKEVFEIISIEELVQKLDLEDYKKMYYEVYGEDLLNYNYKQKFQLDEDSLDEAIFLKLPELKVLNQLKRTKGSNLKDIKNLEKQGIELAKTLILVDQLADLNTFIRKANPLTFRYIESLTQKLVIESEEKREKLTTKIKNEVTIVSEAPLETLSEVKDARDLIQTIDSVAEIKANAGKYPKTPEIQNQWQNFYRKGLGLGTPVHRNQCSNLSSEPEKSPLPKGKIKSKIRNLVTHFVSKKVTVL